MNPSSTTPLSAERPASPNHHIPGYARTKACVIFVGLLVAGLGFSQLWTPLRLLWRGESTIAEAIRVVKVIPGLPDLVLTTDPMIQAEVERRERSAVFWNEFRFQTTAGRTVQVRAPVGNHSRPLYPLVSLDGLPTVDRVCFDPTQPERAIFPLVVSTWLAPGMIFFCGLLATLIGSFLLYWADKPIELPHLPPPAK